MEFWGVEVKSGEPLFVEPGEGMVLHLSQACLGELKNEKGSESICLFVKVDEKKLVLCNLFSDKLPQQQFDLVFDKNFELSHNWKNGSVYFFGYRANNPFDDSEDEYDLGSDSEEDIPVLASNNGKPATQLKQEKSAVVEKPNALKDTAVGKQKVKIVKPDKDVKPDEDDDSDESDDMSADNDSESDEDDESDSQSDEKEDESDEEDEETPKKVETGKKKRPAESATKTPGPDKKSKTVTPQKTDGKKGDGHVATPHPGKKAGKTPADKSNQQTPKSGASHTCKSCNRTFNSNNALDSHTKAKHSGGK